MDIKTLQQLADKLDASATLDKEAYDKIEDFIIKNSSKLAHNPDFEALRDTLVAVARKFGVRDIASIQEGFGLNSCAQ